MELSRKAVVTREEMKGIGKKERKELTIKKRELKEHIMPAKFVDNIKSVKQAKLVPTAIKPPVKSNTLNIKQTERTL